MTSLATLPGFLAYFVAGIAMLVASMWIFMRITPHDELSLIRAGNTAAAVTFGGAMLGFCLPIASALSHSINIVDAVVWGVVALAVQLACFFAMGKLLGGNQREALEEGHMAGATLRAAVAVSVGLLNAACLST
ncbi:DUF350 domain-containing protein [Falsiroseomonas sp. HW251]|uniref:DUF350 domain-containing protein n=1 Tax=Falsiroseomonas sp. HW251 TaxID=3390998 RepID=UPI003D31CC21